MRAGTRAASIAAQGYGLSAAATEAPHRARMKPQTAVPNRETLRALEQIRRMRGGAQSHLMRGSDENYYVVKFQNNPQHKRVLVNELLGTKLARRLGLPTAPVAVIEVSEELICWTEELAMELPRSRVPCAAGRQFASRYPGDPRHVAAFDFLPDEQLRRVRNLHDFAGMLVFDKWTCNTNGRQTLFLRDREAKSREVRDTPGDPAEEPYQTVMIDQGFCFNAGEWNFPDAPLRGLYARNRVYEGVIGMESFGNWLERLERINERALQEMAGEIPPEWYEDDYDAIIRLCDQLWKRRARVPDLILEAKRSHRQPFPNWL